MLCLPIDKVFWSRYQCHARVANLQYHTVIGQWASRLPNGPGRLIRKCHRGMGQNKAKLGMASCNYMAFAAKLLNPSIPKDNDDYVKRSIYHSLIRSITQSRSPGKPEFKGVLFRFMSEQLLQTSGMLVYSSKDNAPRAVTVPDPRDQTLTDSFYSNQNLKWPQDDCIVSNPKLSIVVPQVWYDATRQETSMLLRNCGFDLLLSEAGNNDCLLPL